MFEEQFISGQSGVHRLDPVIRIACACILSVIIALCEAIPAIFAGLALSVILVSIARLPWPAVFVRLKPMFWFVLMIWIILPVTFNGEVILKLGVIEFSREGVQLCIKISLKAVAILLIFNSLIATMSISSLGNGLHRLRVPDKLVFLLLMSYRYIEVIRKEYNRLLRAAKFRGFQPGTNIHSYKTYAYLAGMLFVRASLRARRVHNAMLCRGFGRKFHTLDVYHPTILNYIFLIGVLAAGAVLLAVEIYRV